MDIWSDVICASSGFMLSVRPLSNEKMTEMLTKSAINLRHSTFASSALVKLHWVKNGLALVVAFVTKVEAIKMAFTRLETSTAGLVVVGSVT